MNKISKGIFLEIFPIFLLCNMLFVFIMLMEQMIQLAELLFIHSVPFVIIAKVFICYLPSFLVITIPVSVLISILLAFSRFSADSELIAMYSCGAGKFDLLKPVAIFGVLVFGFSIFVTTVLLPKGSAIALANINLLLQNLSVNDIQEREMYNDIDDIIFYADKKIDKSNFQDVIFVYTKENAVITSKTAAIVPNKNRSLSMKFGVGKFVISEDDNDRYTVLEFDNMLVNYPLNITIESIPGNEKLMTMGELKNSFSQDPSYQFEFYRRFSIPFSSVLMAFCGFYMGIFFQRTGRSLGILSAFALAVCYNALFLLGANFVADFNTLIIAWVPNIFILIFLFFLAYRSK